MGFLFGQARYLFSNDLPFKCEGLYARKSQPFVIESKGKGKQLAGKHESTDQKFAKSVRKGSVFPYHERNKNVPIDDTKISIGIRIKRITSSVEIKR